MAGIAPTSHDPLWRVRQAVEQLDSVRWFVHLAKGWCISLDLAPRSSGKTARYATCLHGRALSRRAFALLLMASATEPIPLFNPHQFHTPQPSYSKAELLNSARGGYFGPGNAQLPSPPMLMMDRIVEISADGGEYGKGHIVAELDINPDLWFFDCHFTGDPVMPGCLGLDAMWQIIGYWLGWSGSPGKGRAIGVGEVRFRGDITPQTKLVRYEVDMHRVKRGALVLGMGDGRVLADGRLIYTAKDMKVGLIKPAIAEVG